MAAVHLAPFFVVFLVGFVCGRLLPSNAAWFIALALPAAHFIVSVVTGRAGEDLLTYVVPVNLALLGLAGTGALIGRAWRRRQVGR